MYIYGFFPNFGQISTSSALLMRLVVHFALQLARIPEPERKIKQNPWTHYPCAPGATERVESHNPGAHGTG